MIQNVLGEKEKLGSMDFMEAWRNEGL